MKVIELMRELAKCDPELPVLVSRDAEGNGFGMLAGIDSNTAFVQEDSYHIEVLHPDDIDE